MAAREPVRQAFFSRDVAVAYVVLVVLYLVRVVRFQPIQIPAYLLIVAYDGVETALPIVTPYYPLGFALFLYLLAILGAGAARWLQSGDEDRLSVSRTIGGVCLIIGTLSLLFGGFIGGPLVAPTDNPTPLAITGATGLILLGGGWWVLRRRSPRDQSL